MSYARTDENSDIYMYGGHSGYEIHFDNRPVELFDINNMGRQECLTQPMFEGRLYFPYGMEDQMVEALKLLKLFGIKVPDHVFTRLAFEKEMKVRWNEKTN